MYCHVVGGGDLNLILNWNNDCFKRLICQLLFLVLIDVASCIAYFHHFIHIWIKECIFTIQRLVIPLILCDIKIIYNKKKWTSTSHLKIGYLKHGVLDKITDINLLIRCLLPFHITFIYRWLSQRWV